MTPPTTLVTAVRERADEDWLSLVLVAEGTAQGIAAGGWQEMSLESDGMAVIHPHPGHFATDVEVGDANGDGYADAFVSALGARDHDKTWPDGGVYVIPGSPDGLDVQWLSNITPRKLGLEDGANTPGEVSYFYQGLLFRDHDGDGYDDLTVMTYHAPAVVVYGSATRPDVERVDVWTLQSRGVKGRGGWESLPER